MTESTRVQFLASWNDWEPGTMYPTSAKDEMGRNLYRIKLDRGITVVNVYPEVWNVRHLDPETDGARMSDKS